MFTTISFFMSQMLNNVSSGHKTGTIRWTGSHLGDPEVETWTQQPLVSIEAKVSNNDTEVETVEDTEDDSLAEKEQIEEQKNGGDDPVITNLDGIFVKKSFI